MHRGIFEERALVLIPFGKQYSAREFNLVLSEILTGHIMVSVFLQESQTEFKKHIPRGLWRSCFWGAQSTPRSTPQAHHC